MTHELAVLGHNYEPQALERSALDAFVQLPDAEATRLQSWMGQPLESDNPLAISQRTDGARQSLIAVVHAENHSTIGLVEVGEGDARRYLTVLLSADQPPELAGEVTMGRPFDEPDQNTGDSLYGIFLGHNGVRVATRQEETSITVVHAAETVEVPQKTQPDRLMVRGLRRLAEKLRFTKSPAQEAPPLLPAWELSADQLSQSVSNRMQEAQLRLWEERNAPDPHDVARLQAWKDQLDKEWAEISPHFATLEQSREVLDVEESHRLRDQQEEELWGFAGSHGRVAELTQSYYRLKNQRDFAEKGIELLFADTLTSQQIEELTHISGESVNPPPSYVLPPTETPPSNLAEVANTLAELPFVRTGSLYGYAQQMDRDHPSIQIKGDKGELVFPMDRIIGIESFNYWSGQRADGMNSKPPENPGQHPVGEETSRGAIAAYAQREVTGDVTDIVIVRDANGEYWGVAGGDGSHRVAAARLRGQRTIGVRRISIAGEKRMPHLLFSVRERFASPVPVS